MSGAFDDKDAKIFVAGHRGMVGSAIVRALQQEGYENLVLRSHAQLDLRDAAAVDALFADERPRYVFVAAAKVGGIVANASYPADFLYDNLAIQNAVIHAAHVHDVKKLQFLGSTCIYPRLAAQPMQEDALLTGPLEETNEAYAIAKIAGIKLCQAYRKQHGRDFISSMPTNLYGPGDNFHPEHSHVIPAMLRRLHEAKEAGDASVTMWGTGTPRREFLHVDDLADAVLFLMKHYSGAQHVNVGVGKDLTIRELAELVREVVGFEGELRFDTSRPDGTPRKLVDTQRINALGWKATTPLREGLKSAYAWYIENAASARGAQRAG